MFSGLQIHRENISRAIFAMLTDPIKTKILTLSSPEIGVHIRRGDFKYGNLLTSNQFFINAINVIRKIEGRPLTVTVFTDAHDREIADILNLDDVQFPVDQSDIVDIYQLSKSKYLILSQSSSFSYWAAFLCNNIVIRHQDDWQKQICHNTSNELKFDGLNIELLMQDLLNLKQSSSFN